MKDPVKTALEADIRRLDATGRIRRSELQRLAWSCGDPDVALEDVEALLHSMDDITAEYLDDMPSDTDVLWFRQCLKLKRELRQSGMDSLSQCLQAPGGMDRLQMLAIWEALDPSQLPCPMLRRLPELLPTEERLREYLQLEEAERVWEELQERKQDGQIELEPHEQERLIEELKERLEINGREAEQLLEKGLQAIGIQSPTRELAPIKAPTQREHRESQGTQKTQEPRETHEPQEQRDTPQARKAQDQQEKQAKQEQSRAMEIKQTVHRGRGRR